MAPTEVIFFLDWDTTRRIVPAAKIPPSSPKQQALQIEKVFERLVPSVAAALISRSRKEIFRVRWRVYHGWHSGSTSTDDLRSFKIFAADARASRFENVSFTADFTFSYDLMCGGKRVPFLDTVRWTEKKDATGKSQLFQRQKMVDTSLTCDLLQSVRSSRETLHFVLGDDDDLIPALVMGERWGGQVHYFRREKLPSSHLKMNGLVSMMNFVGGDDV